jgi:hypothetical protein
LYGVLFKSTTILAMASSSLSDLEREKTRRLLIIQAALHGELRPRPI